MKRISALGLGLTLTLALTCCKDDVYYPYEEIKVVHQVVKVVFDPNIVFPGNNNNNDTPATPGADDNDENYNPVTGNRYIYIFPDDKLDFDVAGLDKAGVSRIDVFVNGNLVDTLEGEDIPEIMHYEIDPKYFRKGTNELELLYTFPNDQQVKRTYYFVVFSEQPRMVMKYDFTPDITIVDSSGEPSPSTVEILSTDPDGRVDYESQTFYLHVGDVKINSSLSTSATGIYGDTWRYELKLGYSLNQEESNVTPDTYNIEIDWDRGACTDDTYTVLSPRTSAIDLDWVNAFQKEIHTVTIKGTCEGYMQEDGHNYYYRTEVNDTYHIVPRPQSTQPIE